METITWGEFEKITICVGTIVTVTDFLEARKPAYKITVDLGPEIGLKKSSAQLKANYTPADLLGRQVVCVTNFKPKQIGNFISEVLITGFPDENGHVVLAQPAAAVPNGSKLFWALQSVLGVIKFNFLHRQAINNFFVYFIQLAYVS